MKALAPTFRVTFGSGESAPQVRSSGRHFRLDHRCLGEFFLARLPPRLDDLLRIGTSVYVIDRLVKRLPRERGEAGHAGCGWPSRSWSRTSGGATRSTAC
jgi:hypothetical protein